MAKNYAKAADKWASKLGGAGQDYIDGVNSVTSNPAQAAIAKQSTMRQRILAAIDNGTWAKALGSVTLSFWQSQAVNIGASRLTAGADKGKAKMARYFNAAAATYQQIRDTVRAMPNGSDAERTARWQKARDMMKSLKGAGKGGSGMGY